MKFPIIILFSILITSCTSAPPICPCEQIPEEQTTQDQSVHSTEFYSSLNVNIEAQIKMVQAKDDLDIAFHNFSDMRSEYITKLGFNHDEVMQYNLIVNQLCNVWRNINNNKNDAKTREICREQYFEGLRDLQALVRKVASPKAQIMSANDFVSKVEKEIATVQLEMNDQPADLADLEALIAQMKHLQKLALQDSSQVEFCNKKLETITQTHKKY